MKLMFKKTAAPTTTVSTTNATTTKFTTIGVETEKLESCKHFQGNFKNISQ